MNEEHDLASLWQAQPVSTIDIEKIKKDYRRQQVRQRCYMLLDIVSVLPVAVLLWYSWSTLPQTTAIMVIILGLVMLPMLGYLLWLRRVTAFGGLSNTTDYLALLTRQMHNNARIAWLTKHSAWLMSLFIIIFYGVTYGQGALPPQKYVQVLIALAVMVVVMAIVYRWAHRREQRFRQRYASLRALAPDK